MIEKTYCSNCNTNVEVDILDIDYNDSDCFMKITCKCKECGKTLVVKVNQ